MPTITYANGATLVDTVDPTSSSEGISQIVYPNFQISNKVEWVNTATRTLWVLYDITDKVYNDSGNLIGGSLVWAKYDLLIPQSDDRK
jgi:hypothetical protein